MAEKEFETVVAEEGIFILIGYEEYPLKQYTFISEREERVTCKAHKISSYVTINLFHDFKYSFGDYYTDCATDLIYTKTIITH